jgi:hypothetical protein
MRRRIRVGGEVGRPHVRSCYRLAAAIAAVEQRKTDVAVTEEHHRSRLGEDAVAESR